MNRNAMWKFSASAALAVAAAAVPSFAVTATGGEASAARPEQAARSAARAEQALERGRTERALRYAEEAVAFDPNNAAHRTTLGQAYMASGRFLSAAESFSAARQLGATDSRTIIGQALSMIAIGRNTDAVQLLDANMGSIPASDYGLALALAGEGQRGALVLVDVVRQHDSTARDRQNLALALAAAGRWLEAQLMAAQDVGAEVATQRVQQWAAMLQAGDPRMRIAGIMGVTPVEDAGMPMALALNGAPVPVALNASNDPAPLALYAPPPPAEGGEAAAVAPAPEAPAEVAVVAQNEAPAPQSAPAAMPEPVQVASAAPAPVAPAPAEAPSMMTAAMESPVVQQSITFVSHPVIQPLRNMVERTMASLRVDAPAAAPPRRARVAAAPAARPAAAAEAGAEAPRGPVQTRGWAVQLGAYNTAAIARTSWGRLSRRHAALSARDGISTIGQVRGRTYYRLVATGYQSRAAAVSACASIARVGGNCFVRQLGAADRVHWASRQSPQRVASAGSRTRIAAR
jgi:D-alanyl-D-alanine carboxypeptidase